MKVCKLFFVATLTGSSSVWARVGQVCSLHTRLWLNIICELVILDKGGLNRWHRYCEDFFVCGIAALIKTLCLCVSSGVSFQRCPLYDTGLQMAFSKLTLSCPLLVSTSALLFYSRPNWITFHRSHCQMLLRTGCVKEPEIWNIQEYRWPGTWVLSKACLFCLP